MVESKRDYAKVFAEKIIEEADCEMTLNAEDIWIKMKICFIQIAKEI